MRAKLDHSIIKVLVYFDIFNYPLSKDEIYYFLDHKADKDEVVNVLNELVVVGRIFRCGEFYSLQDDSALRERRLKGNANAQSMLVIAHKVSAFLSGFPYVRGIGISGSLSKNFADENADIDFFVITKANRLWIARSIMHFFKKLTFLTGRQHWYCMNYYVDEEALRIEEQNIFTATELITLMPEWGNGTMDKFFSANDWATVYYPNFAAGKRNPSKTAKSSWLKKLVEWAFNNKLGDALDNYLMKLTVKRWNKKEEQNRLNIKGNKLSIRSSKHFSKPNPLYFQKKVLAMYQGKLDEQDTKWSKSG